MKTCQRCNGSGNDPQSISMLTTTPCSRCKGRKVEPEYLCKICEGGNAYIHDDYGGRWVSECNSCNNTGINKNPIKEVTPSSNIQAEQTNPQPASGCASFIAVIAIFILLYNLSL